MDLKYHVNRSTCNLSLAFVSKETERLQHKRLPVISRGTSPRVVFDRRLKRLCVLYCKTPAMESIHEFNRAMDNIRPKIHAQFFVFQTPKKDAKREPIYIPPGHVFQYCHAKKGGMDDRTALSFACGVLGKLKRLEIPSPQFTIQHLMDFIRSLEMWGDHYQWFSEFTVENQGKLKTELESRRSKLVPADFKKQLGDYLDSGDVGMVVTTTAHSTGTFPITGEGSL